jgi:hypothetical protein
MKMLSELARDAMELPAPQRLILARILLDVTEENADFPLKSRLPGMMKFRDASSRCGRAPPVPGALIRFLPTWTAGFRDPRDFAYDIWAATIWILAVAHGRRRPNSGLKERKNRFNREAGRKG